VAERRKQVCHGRQIEQNALYGRMSRDLWVVRSPVAAPVIAEQAYFQSGAFTLLHDDAVRALSQLSENSVDMIFADPPYNLSNGGFTMHAERMVSEGTLGHQRGELRLTRRARDRG
jgi:16S rRNA G966 N2-methylase RsmD